MYAEDEAALLLAHPVDAVELEHLVRRRLAGEPLEHVLGWAEFCGLRIEVGPGVFVPRRRSELLVRIAGELASRWSIVSDLCCGSGAVGAALLTEHPSIELHASDIEVTAVEIARRNIEPRGGLVHHGDLLTALPTAVRGHVDVIVVNAPYVPTDEIRLMPPEARDWEPAVALDGGVDGLEVHRRIISESREWLIAGGRLVIETSERQVSEDMRMFGAAGFVAHTVRDDELDATAVVATYGTSSPTLGATPNGRLP